MSRAKEISRDTIILSASQYITQFSNVVKGFLLAKYLGPYYLGVWGTVTLIQQYVPYSTLGTIFAMNREVPFFMAKGEDRRGSTMEISIKDLLEMVARLTGIERRLWGIRASRMVSPGVVWTRAMLSRCLDSGQRSRFEEGMCKTG